MNTYTERSEELGILLERVSNVMQQLPRMKHRRYIERSLNTLVRLAADDLDRLDWKILSSSLQDMGQAFQAFHPYRHTRKVTIFGSARTPEDAPEYKVAAEFARRITEQGFMVMTGAGGGIMQAGNEGAGAANSFGLNIRLPFEQEANPAIAGDDKLISFKYFFTRKLFLLKESDAIALFPGGFGTQDEAFETLTLAQTGKYGPTPLVLIDRPGGDYWHEWSAFVYKHLLGRQLISPEDTSFYTITDNTDVACETIRQFYRVYHSSRYVGDLFVVRLKSELSDAEVDRLNRDFGDLLVAGKMVKSAPLPEEEVDEIEQSSSDRSVEPLPRLVFQFNQRSFGRLYQLVDAINQMGDSSPALAHPEHK